MTRWGRASLVLILVAAPRGQAHAQRQSSRRNWVTLGLGQATWGGLTELGGQFTFSHQRGRMVVTGRGLVGFLLGDVLQVPGMITSVEDYGLMVGAGSRPGLIRYVAGSRRWRGDDHPQGQLGQRRFPHQDLWRSARRAALSPTDPVRGTRVLRLRRSQQAEKLLGMEHQRRARPRALNDCGTA